MTLQSSAASPADPSRRTRRAERDLAADPKEALEQMLLNAHRLAVSLGDLGVFRHSEVSVAEWAIMKLLHGREDVPIRQISALSGVSRQRLRKIISELESKGLVVAGKSSAEDKRVHTISATPTATRVLSVISRQMQELVPKTAKSGRRRSLGVAARSMEQVVRTIRRNWQVKRSKRRKPDPHGERTGEQGVSQASS